MIVMAFMMTMQMIKKKMLHNELRQRYRLLVDNSASFVNVRTPRLPCHFPARELVLDKLTQPGRSLGEADTSDCFHNIDADKRYRWLVALFSEKYGPLQFTTLSQGHVNSVHYCLKLVYWLYAHLREKGFITKRASGAFFPTGLGTRSDDAECWAENHMCPTLTRSTG